MIHEEHRKEKEIKKPVKTKRKRGIVRVLACFVVFCTTYALILPAITMEREAYCGHTAHVHDSSCYTKELICPLEETEGTEGHTHTEACYETERVLICGQEEMEADEGHAHTEACYDEEGNLICGEEEREPVEGHTHTDACYEEQKTLICGKEEQPAAEGHKHTEDCYEKVLSCGMKEHKHTLACYSNPDADVETSGQWEQTLPDQDKLTGIWADDLLTVAESQLGYEESVRNYEVVGESTKGYTRYGAWYGVPYGDWCAMYISFCLHYADIPKDAIPYEASCAAWVEKLKKKDMYLEAKDGKPRPGDLIFFEHNNDEDKDADHVGIVIKVDKKKGIDTIEGNTSNKVAHRHYDWDDEQILGYGVLPENPHPSKDTDKETAESSPIVREFTGKTDSVSVRVEAPSEAFPEDTTMELEEVDGDEVLDAVTDAVEGNVVHVDAVDIKFIHDGKEIEPSVPIRVSMVPEEEAQSGDPAVVHVPDEGKAEQVETMSLQEGESGLAFESDAFSVYALVYTVDFHYEVDGETFDMSFPGGGFASFTDVIRTLGVVKDDEDTEADEVALFVADVDKVVFSDTTLVSASKVEKDTTVADIKDALGLTCEYSADLTEEQIDAINATEVKAGDWALISLKPFDTEESLTVTMKNGEAFTIKVTDATEIHDAESTTIDANKSYLICYQVGNQYYLLKNDGTVDSTHNPNNFENLNSTYCWTFNYVFQEKHLEPTMTYNYYLIRPIDHKQKTLALYAEGGDLVQQSNNNVAVVPAEGGGFHLIGYNEVKLNFANGTFFADELPKGNDGVVVHIYEMDTLPTYHYTVRSADEERGTVTVQGGTQQTDTDGSHYYDAESNSDKKNAGTITATPVDHRNPPGAWWRPNKWEFDHWELDGVPLDRDQYPDTINANSLPIPFNGSNLVAYFKQNANYVVPDNEKEASNVENMEGWINDLKNRDIPLDESATKKTAEVYDYENRIYRVDITSKANFETFDGNVDMAFCMDVSNSMKFPSKLQAYPGYERVDIRAINGPYTDAQGVYHQAYSLPWMYPPDGSYYIISDINHTSTVYRLTWRNNQWEAKDASAPDTSYARVDGNTKFKTENDGNDDNDNNFTYQLYYNSDSPNVRFDYLNQSFTSATTDLKTIMDLLAVASNNKSPDVRVAYNTFNKELGNRSDSRQDFQTVTPLSVSFEYSAGGGTRPDLAFADAQNFDWQGNDRYVVLITDGAPQGVRKDKNGNVIGPADNLAIEQEVRDQAAALKRNKNVKLITIGLSMGNVDNGRKLLYDIADTDKDGNKMFYMAESGDELENILRKIIKTIMDDATVIANVTDTVNEAFYPVNKATGLPLKPGDKIDIDGNLTTDSSKVAGIVQNDGKTIKWMSQEIDQQNGWHGTVYVKAKEDLIGGNAVKTNGTAEVEATHYTFGGNPIPFDQSLVGDKLKSLEIGLDSPRVNVNELTFPGTETEWTVYLGTSVDPKEQLKQMYEDILVSGVVNTEGDLHYALEPNSIVDDRTTGEHGHAITFSLANEILEAIKADPGLSALYVTNGALNWDKFLEDILKPQGVTVPYHKYGVEGEDSTIVIKLSKEIKEGEETDLVTKSPHATTVVNDTADGQNVPVEKYVLTVQYNPDYDHVLPPGQGGKNPDAPDFHTGTFGTMYQGHATGRETSTNTHVINVFAKGLQIFKTAPDGTTMLKNAEFTLYRTARDNETDPSKITTITVNQAEKRVYPAATLTTNDAGVASVTPVEQLNENEEYYLVETRAPDGYNRLKVVIPVTLSINDSYTEVDGTPITEPGDDIYNWEQTATLKLGSVSSVFRTDADMHRINEPSANSNNEFVYYQIDNTPGYVLPHTGGPGVTVYVLVGLLLITTSGFLILRRKRKAIT